MARHSRGSRLCARLLGALLSLAVLLPAAACARNEATPGPSRANIAAEQQQVLDLRDEAVRAGDRKLFMSTVARGDRVFVQRQRRWFDNVSKLPWRTLRHRALTSSWPVLVHDDAWGKKVAVPRIRLVAQLKSFDHTPVRQLTGLAFARREGVLKIVGDRTRAGSFFPGYTPSPWDLTRINVRQTGTVLGVFDAGTLPDRDAVMRSVLAGVQQVSRGLPFAWDRRVVVYAFTDRAVLNSFEHVPGGKIQHLGALTFPVRAGPDDTRVVGLRFTLLPSSIAAGQPFLGRIVRHELTHVALGERDDGVPLWFSEGIAEYLGARGVPLDQRRIAAVAVDRARSGVATRLPPSAGFNGPEQDWYYALSWMACDHIAATQGEGRLWQLMRALSDYGRGTSDQEQDAVLRQVLGYGARELAGAASERIRSIYR